MAQGIFNLKQANQAIRQGAWSAFNPPQFVEYLVVAGGGGGGIENSGGGGAGGLLTGIVPVTTGSSYTVTVGSGGAGTANSSGTGTSGANSAFSVITTLGGGGGGSRFSTTSMSGGSGGGAGQNSGGTDTSPRYGGQGTFNQGNSGGTYLSNAPRWAGGGGGGAGAVGTNSSTSFAGNGGAGIASAISGTVTVYAGGGGGGTRDGLIAGTGGVGGGGPGASSSSALGTNGLAGFGGGGGGGGQGDPYAGGNGGSGIVIVRYPGSVQFYTGGAVTYANGHVVHKFYVTDTLAPTTPTALATSEYQISRSLRFNSADTAYLNRTPATAGNRRTWTLSFWIKKTANGASYTNIFGAAAGASNRTDILWHPSDYLRYYDYDNSYSWFAADSAGSANWNLYRDVSAWYHIVIAVDTTQANNVDRVKGYVNGSFVANGGTDTYTQNAQTQVNSTVAHNLGAHPIYGQNMNAYLTEVNFIDGQQLTSSSFGETNPNTGVWQPKAYTGTYGTNGFYLNFSDNSNITAATLGKDYSGNANNWTPNNFSVTAGAGNDSMVDTPTPYGTDTGVGGQVRGNYATLNPLSAFYTDKTFTNGNLQVTGTTTNQVGAVSTIQLPRTGQWYAECTMTATGGGSPFIGVSTGTTAGMNAASYRADGTKELNGTGSAYGATWTTNDVIGVAVDMSAGSITFYKNGTSQGVAFTSLSQFTSLFFAFQNGAGGAACTFIYNFGQRAFAYTAPPGYKALCTTNLPPPPIGSSATSLATKYFNSVVWTGNSANPRTITGVGFQPDWVWVKRRDAGGNNFLQDAVRGVTSTDSKSLSSNNTDAETNYYTLNGGVTAFTSDGFTTSGGSTNLNINGSGQTYVGWNWKASNATAVTNTSGSLTSQVSANPTAGFSVLTYTGNAAAAQTIGHGLGVPPAMIIVKGRTGGNWSVWHKSFSRNQYLFLNSQDVPNTVTGYWGTSDPTSTVFGVIGGGYGNNSGTAVAYCFAEIEGYSKFSSFTGNGSADGPFVYTGFRPAFLLTKDISNAATNWYLWDSVRSAYNSNYNLAYPGSNDAENTTALPVDFLSNGFKPRVAGNGFNTGSATVIYMAFASNPFKYSLAR